VLNLAFAAAGLGTLALLGIIAARLFRPDTNLFFIWANAYTFWIYLPAYAVLIAAAVFQRWLIFGLALIVAAFHLAWILPDYRPAEDIPEAALTAPRLKLMTANVYFQNPDFSAIAAEILAEDPDVLFLQEYGPELEDALERAGVIAMLPYGEVAFENPYFGSAIRSKLPISDVQIIQAGGRPVIRANVDVGGVTVTLYNLHPTSPGFGTSVAEDWNEGWKIITEELAKAPGPMIAAGDFNLNQHHTWYRELKNDGLDNCHEERGRGNATTWPKGRKLRPIRIDHVFHGDDVVCLSIREGVGEGSDHRPLIAELAFLPR
jgi:endonuclease/exonuclease/phosphatase (EEP) superfamily protein YafD